MYSGIKVGGCIIVGTNPSGTVKDHKNLKEGKVARDYLLRS